MKKQLIAIGISIILILGFPTTLLLYFFDYKRDGTWTLMGDKSFRSYLKFMLYY